MTMLKIPDLGGSSQVEIIEISVQVGDAVEHEQTVLVLETDKATMEIPADQAGVIKKLLVKVGDKVSSGDAIAEIDAAGAKTEEKAAAKAETAAAPVKQEAAKTASVETEQAAPAAAATTQEETILVPDLGTTDAVPIIELLVSVGDSVDAEQTIVVLESSKATMEVPVPKAGTIVSLAVKVGDSVTSGSPLLVLKTTSAAPAAEKAPAVASSAPAPVAASKAAEPAKVAVPVAASNVSTGGEVHAGPAVRKLARELGVNLTEVKGSGSRGRIQKDDVHSYVKSRMQAGAGQGGGTVGLPKVPEIDFSQFGKISEQPLNNVKRATARAMTTALLNVPQVTQFDLADITDLEAYRVKQNERFAKQGIKFSLVPFVMKALARCLKDFPTFNASLSPSGESLILKEYVHLGVAVDTPKGLLVPVIRDVDQLSITAITSKLQEKATSARDGKLSLADMQGSCMSVSSLGGIGGTAFTPIVNPPEVAILGLSKASMQPVWNGTEFVPRLMLPLSLSYDHRVIDGAEAARFTQRLASYLQDFRDILM